MTKKKLVSILPFIIIMGMFFCAWQALKFLSLFNSLNQRLKPGKCEVPSQEILTEDLVGTWYAGSPERSDTLIIKDDGKYKQIIHIEYLNVDFESDWQQWSIEYSESGIPYLHMEKMLLCAAEPEIVSCDQSGGQGPWYDFCRNESMQMDNEGILIVLGEPERLLRSPNRSGGEGGISLWLPEGFEDSWVYALRQP